MPCFIGGIYLSRLFVLFHAVNKQNLQSNRCMVPRWSDCCVRMQGNESLVCSFVNLVYLAILIRFVSWHNTQVSNCWNEDQESSKSSNYETPWTEKFDGNCEVEPRFQACVIIDYCRRLYHSCDIGSTYKFIHFLVSCQIKCSRLINQACS